MKCTVVKHIIIKIENFQNIGVIVLFIIYVTLRNAAFSLN